ncbi:MAG: hypothetical protein ACKVQR_11170, partial [Aquabacterium sp.]
MTARIYDCFIYNGEPILDLRLRLLSPHVHRFVVVESTLTFKGEAKAARFDAAAYTAWAGQIDYHLMAATDFDACVTAWDREALQRNAVLRGLADARDDDVVLLSDVDEIPDPRALAAFDGRPSWLRQLSMAYYGNLMCRNDPYWLKGTRMVRVADFRRFTAEDIRLRFERCFPDGRMLADGGWHFTYLGGVASIRRKIGEFSHQELNTAELTAEASIRAQIDARLDIFYRPYSFAAVRPQSLGHDVAAAWLRQHDLLVPGGDDGLDCADVAAAHGRQPYWLRRLLRLG